MALHRRTAAVQAASRRYKAIVVEHAQEATRRRLALEAEEATELAVRKGIMEAGQNKGDVTTT